MPGGESVVGGAGVTPRGGLDRNAPTPLYYQLKLALLDSFRHAGMQPGDQVPPEAAIEKEYGVSRTTIRQALGELEADGIIDRIQGKGSFLRAKPVQHVAGLTSFDQDMRAHGLIPSRKLLELRVVGASREAAERLGCDEEDPCYFLRRLMIADGETIGLAETWLPVAALGEGADRLQALGGQSLYRLLRDPPFSLVLTSGSEVLSARPAEPETAQLLACGAGDALLCVERVARTDSGHVVEWTRTVFPWERYQYSVEIAVP